MLAISLQETERTAKKPLRGEMSLYGTTGVRKYLTATERRRFLAAAKTMPLHIYLFCSILAASGCRISEARAITAAACDLDAGIINIETLKKRRRGIVRQVPLPRPLLRELDRTFNLRRRQRDPYTGTMRLWPWSRTTAWRYVKRVMRLAGITGQFAMPKGLRHAFGVTAFETVPPHMVQRWLGHASLRTTSIYGQVVGNEERTYARRLWRRW